MTADEVADAVTRQLMAHLEPAVDEYGAQLAEEVRKLVSVPVEHIGSRVIRSAPGEPPRKEFERYINSITHGTRVDGDRVTTEAGTPMQRGVWLEGGTDRIKPRPHWSVAYRNAREEAARSIREKL